MLAQGRETAARARLAGALALAQERESGAPLWKTLPPMVPRSQWEGNLTDVHTLVEEILRRVAKLENSNQTTNVQLAGLHQTCREQLASREALSFVERKLTLDVADIQANIMAQLDRLSTSLSAEIAQLQNASDARLHALTQGVQDAGIELKRLDLSMAQEVADIKASFVTKILQGQAIHELRSELFLPLAETTRGVKTLEARAQLSQEEYAAIHKELRDATNALDNSFISTTQSLRISLRELQELTGRTVLNLEGLKTETCTLLIGLREQIDIAAADLKGLRKDVEADTEKLTSQGSVLNEHSFQLQEVMHDLGGHSNNFSSRVEEVYADFSKRFDKLREEVIVLDRRERSSWAQFISERR